MANEYVTVAELKTTLSLGASVFADADLARAAEAASRAVDGITDSQFYPGTTGEVRKYTPVSQDYLLIDDASSVTAVSAAGTALVLDTNYAKMGAPVTTHLRTLGGYLFPRGTVNGMAVTGTFGWMAAPVDVKQATLILASRLLKRSREAAFGVVDIGLEGEAVRIPGRDPDVQRLLAPYTRSHMIE